MQSTAIGCRHSLKGMAGSRDVRWRVVTGLSGFVNWPSVAQVMRRTCERTIVATGEYSCEVSYGITDLTPAQAGACELEKIWHGHWTIENRNHYVRDVTMGEDAGQAHTGSTAQALAACRN